MALWKFNKRTFEMGFPRGDTPRIKINVDVPTGVVPTITFTMRKEATKQSPILVTKALDLEDGEYYLQFEEADTRDLDYGKYYYDVEYREPNSTPIRTQTLILSTIELTKEVTVHD